MTLLVDSQSLIWWVDQDHLLSPSARAAISDPRNNLLVSAATVWGIAIKVGLGKLSLNRPFFPWMSQALVDLGAALLPIRVEHADVQAGLPMHHRDPFDRMLIAQAIVERLTIVSNDTRFDLYGVTRIW